MKTIEELKKAIEVEPARSAWTKGVKVYALELIEQLEENAKYNGLADNNMEFYGSPADRKSLLNGADNWSQYSEGGCSLVYDADIAERVCSPSELKKTKGGEWSPNRRETWIDVQARALFQAERMILRLAR